MSPLRLPRPLVRGTRGVCACGHPLGASAAAEIVRGRRLRRGRGRGGGRRPVGRGSRPVWPRRRRAPARLAAHRRARRLQRLGEQSAVADRADTRGRRWHGGGPGRGRRMDRCSPPVRSPRTRPGPGSRRQRWPRPAFPWERRLRAPCPGSAHGSSGQRRAFRCSPPGSGQVRLSDSPSLPPRCGASLTVAPRASTPARWRTPSRWPHSGTAGAWMKATWRRIGPSCWRRSPRVGWVTR